MLLAGLAPLAIAADNQLTAQEKRAGWILLFDGKSLEGWMRSDGQPSRRPVEDRSINPHKSGHYMMVHKKMWGDFVLALDFKISPRTNTGIFVRTFPLEARPGKDVGYNGLEIAIDDTPGAGYHDTGAIYDLVKPARNAMKPAGRWNHIRIACEGSIVDVELNGENVSRIDLEQFPEPNLRPDGSHHKFDVALRNHPRAGFIGLQDHGSDCWFKNIKLRQILRTK